MADNPTTFVNGLQVDEFELSDTVWDDLRVPVYSTKRGGSKDPDFVKILDNGAGSQGVFAELFSASTEEELYFAVQMPHSWKQGTDIKTHVHWSPVATGSGAISWGLEYTMQEIGATFPATTIISGNTPVPNESLVADRHYLTGLGTIDMSAVDSVSAMIICRVFRDATGALQTDDYASDVALLEVDFHFEIDTMGSRSEYTK